MKSVRWLLVTMIACGSTQDLSTGTNQQVQQPGHAPKPQAGDISLDVDKVSLEGNTFEPEALGRPGMPLIDAKKPTTIAAERQAIATTKDPVLKQAHAAVLATLYYLDAKKDKTREKQLWGDARKALIDAAGGVDAKTVDELTVQLIATYHVIFEDWPAADHAWEVLIKMAPKAVDVDSNRAWWAYSLMKQGKHAEAAKAVVCNDKPPACPKPVTLSPQQPELAYVTAWTKWRSGDIPGAVDAILIADEGWGNRAGPEVIERDTLLFASRSDLTFAAFEPRLYKALSITDNMKKYQILARLGVQGYGYAGRWADGIAAIDKAIAYAGATIPPNELPVLRRAQADFSVAIDQPDAASKYGKDALAALPKCGSKCSANMQQDVVKRVATTALVFHILYATANDVRYYQPANDLYIAAIPLITSGAFRTEVNNGATGLQQTLKNMKAGTGSHERGAVGAILGYHAQEVQACYEAALASDGKLGGQLVVNLDFDPTGAVSVVATEPTAGQSGVSAVAGCVERHAKSWKLPKRGVPGSTRVKMSFSMAPQKKPTASVQGAAPAPATGATPSGVAAPAGSGKR